MRILCVGDVCGAVGCCYAASVLPEYRRRQKIDFTVINGENSADGNGITPQSAEMLFAAGADVITGGNHTLRRREVYALLDDNPFLLRPENLPVTVGTGYCTVDLGYARVAVCNLSGQYFLERLNPGNPFTAVDGLLQRAEADGICVVLVDFHAEATSEKRAMGFYLDGRATAMFGTHTHVLSADAQILPGGTGYITDIGMTGPEQSVLGVKKEIIIDRLKNGGQQKFCLADGCCCLTGCIFEVDIHTGKTVAVQTVLLREAAV